MNSWGTFLLTLAAVVLQTAVSQPSFGASTCFNTGDGGSGSGCKNAENPSDPTDVLKNAFRKCNDMVLAAENRAVTGIAQASKVLNFGPEAVLKTIQEAIQDSENMFYQAGNVMFLSLAKALRLSNDRARQGLIESTQNLQIVALHTLDEMRIALTLANQGKDTGVDALRQVIEAIGQNMQTAFAPVYGHISKTLKKALDAVAFAQSQPMTGKVSSRYAVNEVKDSDTKTAISEIRKAAANAISRGSNASRVNQTSEALISSLAELAEVASFVRNQASNIQKLAPGGAQSSAKNVFSKDFEAVNGNIQRIVVSVLLDIGSAAPNLSLQQIEKAIELVEHGSDEVHYSFLLAKQIILSAFENEGNARKLELDSAVQMARYGKIALDQRAVGAAKILFDVL